MQEVSEEIALELELNEALIQLKDSFLRVLSLCDYEKAFNPETYPFDTAFLEITDKVIDWVDSETAGHKSPDNDPEYEAKMLYLKGLGLRPLKRPLDYYCSETGSFLSDTYIRETSLGHLQINIQMMKERRQKGK